MKNNEKINTVYKRRIKIGAIPTGEKNHIVDVPGVLVGHATIHTKKHHTGVTAILPHAKNIFQEKVVAACDVYNGFGKSIGLIQVEELGTIETPILLTNTLGIGKVIDGLYEYMIRQNPEIGRTTSASNPLVFECNDGNLNDMQARILDEAHVLEAIDTASSIPHQGSIGAGSGMCCHGMKAGIGSSSRVVTIQDQNYVLGVLVNANFQGSNASDLVFCNRPIGKEITQQANLRKEVDKGSIIVIIGTNLPLESRQLRRLAKRAVIGIGRTGAYASNGSGDVFCAFTTQNTILHDSTASTRSMTVMQDDALNSVFQAVIDATEEAVLNSMLASDETIGYDGTVVPSIHQWQNLFKDLLIEE